jgi:hypothetical protein
MNEETLASATVGRGPGDVQVVRSSRVSWSSIFAGAVVALGLWALLYCFGAAAGLTAIDPEDPDSARVAGIGTGIWSVVSPLVALFVGGLVAARLAGPITRGNGMMHGLVLWGATMIAGIVMVSSLVGSLLGGATRVGKQALSATAAAATGLGTAGGSLGQALGISGDELVAPVNQRLRAEGKPEITAPQIQAVLRDVSGTALRQGELDRSLLVSSLAEKTALSRRDAEEIATSIEQRFQAAKARGGQALEQVQTGALKAADTTGKVMWGAFGALLLGLLAALGGGAVGAHVYARPNAGRAVPLGRPGAVHP